MTTSFFEVNVRHFTKYQQPIYMYWILFLYLIAAYFVPELGIIAIICSRASCDGGSQGQILVRSLLSSRKSLRQSGQPLLASQTHPKFCAQQRFPHLYAHVHIRNVRSSALSQWTHTCRNRPHILEPHYVHHLGWHCAGGHLCSPHLV